jgi:hypothetical protein
VFINDNALGSPQIVSLTNTGAAPAMSLSATILSFSSELVGTMSAINSLRVSNTGGRTLLLNSLTIGGAQGGDFVLSQNNCGTTISTDTSCIIGIFFSPSTVGPERATLTINGNVAGNPPTVLLSGTGMDFSLNAADSGITSTAITAGQTATYNLQAAPLGGFTGSAALSVNCSGVLLESTCVATPGSVMMSGTSPVPVAVIIDTTARSAQLNAALLMPVLVLVLLAGDAMRLKGFTRAKFVASTLLFIVSALAGCAGTVGSAAQGMPPGTPPGVYTIIVTATSQGASRTLNLTLTVK